MEHHNSKQFIQFKKCANISLCGFLLNHLPLRLVSFYTAKLFFMIIGLGVTNISKYKCKTRGSKLLTIPHKGVAKYCDDIKYIYLHKLPC